MNAATKNLISAVGGVIVAIAALSGIHIATEVKALENDLIVGFGGMLAAYTVGKAIVAKIQDRGN